MNYLNAIATVVTTLVLIGCSSSESVQKENIEIAKPNVIFILVDDMGYGELGSFGQKIIKTPNLDELAKEGMKFNQFYAGSAVCAPSRGVLMTGQHSGHAQIRGNYDMGGGFDMETEFGQYPLRPGTTTLGTVMKKAGYKTAAIGKWGMGGPDSQGIPNKQGFDYFYGYLDQKQAHNHTPTHLWRNQERELLNNEHIDMHHLKLDSFDYSDPANYEKFTGHDFAQERLNESALNFIEENKEQPFFLYLSYAMPHAALQAPDEEIEKYYFDIDEPAKARYYGPTYKPRATRAAMVTYTDKHIGKVIDKLKDLGIAKNTLVIFTSDNGASPEGGVDLDFFNIQGGLRGIKRELYEGGIRMPTLAWWPGKIKANSESNHIAAFWDVMPTMAELANVAIPQSTDGISFLPELTGQKQDKHSYLYWEFPHAKKPAQAVRKGKWKAIRLFKGNRVKGYTSKIELYNLDKDVDESHNVVNEYPDVANSLIQLMNTSRDRSDIDQWNFD